MAYAMKDMELTDDEQLDAVCPIPMPDKPKYPYGLRICLTEAEFTKLGLDPSEAFIDGMVHGHFMAKITEVACTDTQSGSRARVELQITQLAIESEDEENE